MTLTRRIPASEWPSFADRFSRTHDGWSASLELRDDRGNTETEFDDRPFRGLAFEVRGAHDALVLMFGDDADEHVAHILEHPRDIRVEEAEDGSESSLIVSAHEGSGCLVELTSPFAEA